MADITDVSDALQSVAAGAIYPNGSGSASAVGADCRIYVGWPVPAQLDQDMGNGVAHFSVYPMPGMDRNTTRYPKVWQQQSEQSKTLTLTRSGDALTIGGIATAGHILMIVFPGNAYTYTVQSGDSLSAIASGIASAVPNASASGATVTFPQPFAAREIVQGTVIREVRRQERVFKLSAWAPSNALRNSLGKTVDAAFAALEFIDLPDQKARIIYAGTMQSDKLERQRIYRRDLHFRVDYATTQTKTATTIGTVEITEETDQGTVIGSTYY